MWILRQISRLPMGVLYAFATLTYWLAFRIGGLRVAVTRGNIERSFPELSAAERAGICDRYHRWVADLAWEFIKGYTIGAEELDRRMVVEGIEAVQAHLAAGQSVMMLTAHHCNWEWLLLKLSRTLGYPVEAMYKPLHAPFVQRAALAIRTRFGTRLIPAKELVPETIKRHRDVRALCMVADQVPQTSPRRFWTRFLSQDTAFYMGAEEISRATEYPVYLLLLERTGRGCYRGALRLLAAPGDGSEVVKEITRRYAAALEAHIRAHPDEWLWSHRRWKLKKTLYAR